MTQIFTAVMIFGIYLVLGWQGLIGGLVLAVVFQIGHRVKHGYWFE